jgi:hypothetical protein
MPQLQCEFSFIKHSVKDYVEAKDPLNLENSDGMFSQQLLGYFENKHEVDNGYDGCYDGEITLISPFMK